MLVVFKLHNLSPEILYLKKHFHLLPFVYIFVIIYLLKYYERSDL